MTRIGIDNLIFVPSALGNQTTFVIKSIFEKLISF